MIKMSILDSLHYTIHSHQVLSSCNESICIHSSATHYFFYNLSSYFPFLCVKISFKGNFCISPAYFVCLSPKYSPVRETHKPRHCSRITLYIYIDNYNHLSDFPDNPVIPAVNHVKRKQERRAARGTAHYDTSSSSDSCDSTDTELEPVTAQRKRHRADPTGF